MRTITNQDLNAAFARYHHALWALGIEAGTLALINGSKTYGNSFKAVYVDPENGGHRDAPGTFSGYLGMTRRETYDSLQNLARAFEYMIDRTY